MKINRVKNTWNNLKGGNRMANEYQLLSLNIGLPKEVTYGGKVIHTGINKKQVKRTGVFILCKI